jgi:hypothetical protein
LDSGPPVQVVSRKTIVVPQMPPRAPNGPDEFLLRVPFDTFFHWQTVPGRNLLWEVRVYANDRNNLPFVYDLDGAIQTTTSRVFANTPNGTSGFLQIALGMVIRLDGSSYATFGFGCPGSNGVPQLLPNQPPRIGKPFSILLTNLPTQSLAILLWGFSRDAWGPFPLPLALAPIGMPGCDLLASGEIVLTIPDTGTFGAQVWGLTLANDPRNIGRRFYNQVLILDPGANPAGLIVSNAGCGLILPP